MRVVDAHIRRGGQHRFSCDYEMLARLWEEEGSVQIEPRAFRSSRLKDLEINSDVGASESLAVERACPGALCLTNRHRINVSHPGCPYD